MKRILLSLLSLSLAASFTTAQTAVNFTATDCDGMSHDLFSELDSGKVVVLCWVMPCAACTGPALTSYNVVNSYQASYPGRVVFYMVDDYANTSCIGLNSWGNTNNILLTSWSRRFSTASIDMMDYGSTGMPKIVVVGGSNHAVFYNVNNTVNATNLQNAINSALIPTGIDETNKTNALFTLYPNPASGLVNVKFELSKPASVKIELFAPNGALVRVTDKGTLPAGENIIELSTSGLAAGTYLVKLSDGTLTRFNHLVITR